EGDAVRLFVERSGEDTSLGTVAEICRRIDCLPLAVELAAARTTSFSLDELLERLDQRLLLLTEGPRDAPDRQKTLRATIQWSYDLLEPGEQTLLSRLSAFIGGCTEQAAKDVCDADPDQLRALATKSLLRRQNGRYTMLDTIHELAEEL